MGGNDGEFVGAGVGTKPNFSPTSPIFNFFFIILYLILVIRMGILSFSF